MKTAQLLHFQKIRIRLFFRNLQQAGWGILLVALVLCAGVIISFLSKIMEKPLPIWGILLAVPVFLWHFQRRDGRFLQQIGLAARPVFWLEYGLVSVPAAVVLIFGENWKGLILLGLCIFLTPFFPLPDKKSDDKTTNFSLDFLPGWAFEWKSGIRQTGYGFCFFWLLGLAGSWWVGTLPLFAFLFGTMLISFFENIENKEIMQSQFAKSGGFWQKTAKNVLFADLLFLPHALVFLIFNFQYWYFLLAIFGFISLMTAFSVAAKYANWYPGRRRASNSLLSGLFVFFTVSAIFTPVAIAWWVWKAWQAQKMLNKYF